MHYDPDDPAYRDVCEYEYQRPISWHWLWAAIMLALGSLFL